MRALLALAAVVAIGCGPMLGQPQPQKNAHFLVRFQNDTDTAVPTTASWWHESTVVGNMCTDVQPHKHVIFDLGTQKPDGFLCETVAWPKGFILQEPEYRDSWVVEIHYPTGIWSK